MRDWGKFFPFYILIAVFFLDRRRALACSYLLVLSSNIISSKRPSLSHQFRAGAFVTLSHSALFSSLIPIATNHLNCFAYVCLFLGSPLEENSTEIRHFVLFSSAVLKPGVEQVYNRFL